VNEIWNRFIFSQGAVFEGDAVRFGSAVEENRRAATADVVIDLSSLSLIRARGPDAAAFLHGQLSSDVRALDGTHSQIASYNSPQGRMYAVLRLFHRGDDLLIQLPAALSTDIQRRLHMYVMRSKVAIEDVDAELCCFGVSGPGAVSRVREAVGAAPAAVNDAITHGDVTVLRLPGLYPRFELVAPGDVAIGLWEKFRNGAVPVGSGAWSWLDIVAGIPVVLPPTSEAFVPQMSNLDLLGGISFTKGCYPGQEIVARMRYLGRLKQRMFRAHVACDAPPQAGDSLYADVFRDQPAGTVVNTAPSPEGGFDLLAVMQITVVDGDVHLGAADGPLLVPRTLPYPISCGNLTAPDG
jgi:tRNA-modifying protein YgfZ